MKYKITLTVESEYGFTSKEIIEKETNDGDIPVSYFFKVSESMARRYCSLTQIIEEFKSRASTLEWVKDHKYLDDQTKPQT